jgi:hypothetical protein
MNALSENNQSTPDGMVRGPDYLKALEAVNGAAGDEFDLTQLQPNDRLRIVTDKTIYTFRIVDPVMRDAVVESNRPESSYGPCRIMGCTMGLSSSIKPNHLFCGGNLEFTHKAGERTRTTTAIRVIEWLRVKADSNGRQS